MFSLTKRGILLTQVRLQEEFDRERERLVRERHEIKMACGVGVGGVAGVVFGAGGVAGRLGPNNNDEVGLKFCENIAMAIRMLQERFAFCLS